MIEEWINFYPTLKKKSRYLFNDMVLRDRSNGPLPTYSQFLTFLNLIATDLLKILHPSVPTGQLYADKDFRSVLEEVRRADHSKLLASDLLMFLSSVIPKMLLNILLMKESLPPSMK